MKQASIKAGIKIKSYAGSLNGRVTIVNSGNLERRILYMLLSALGILAVCYLFILTSMVVNIVERKTLEANARSLSDQVSSMELNYLSLSNGINQNLGLSMGFQEPSTVYATRKALGSASDIASTSL